MIRIVLHNLHKKPHLNRLERHKIRKRLSAHLEHAEADTVVQTSLQVVVAVPLEVPLVSLLVELPWQRAERQLGLPGVAVVLVGARLVPVPSVEIPRQVGFPEHERLFSDSCSLPVDRTRRKSNSTQQ